MTEEASRLELMGAPGSPYTRKMLALLRYRRIPHAIMWGGHQAPPAGYPEPKVKLLPTVYFRDASGVLEAAVDSTPILRRLEREVPGRSVIPPDPAIGFLNDLIEDFADEWLTKAMFHFRWYHQADRENAGPLLVYWSQPTLAADAAQHAAEAFTKRQFDRLYVVGSNDVTALTIEASYERFVSILDALVAARGYMLGARPASADFAIYGQLTQLALVEPTSAAITAKRSPRVRAWLDRMEDLSGLRDVADDWSDRDTLAGALGPFLTEIGRVYAPFLLANASAVMSGADQVEAEIDGRPWTQPPFPYQAKCLAALREARDALSSDDQAWVDATLSGTGCEALFQQA